MDTRLIHAAGIAACWRKVWMATAMSVFSRLFIWVEVSTHRNLPLIERVRKKIRQAAGSLPQAVLFAVDGFSAYPKAILKTFYTPLHTGKRGRPGHLPWLDLHIVQMVKTRSGRKHQEITRRLVHGASDRVYEMIALETMKTWLHPFGQNPLTTEFLLLLGAGVMLGAYR